VYENWVRHCALEEVEKLGDGFLGVAGAVAMRVAFWMERPKSVTRKNRPHHTVKPDLDNLLKSIKDGLKLACVYKDDAQVVRIETSKHYADDTEVGTRVELWAIE
jgi:Holliday junction resolvase RusA-like endonuclease